MMTGAFVTNIRIIEQMNKRVSSTSNKQSRITMSVESQDTTTVKDCKVDRLEAVFAVSTPIAGPDGQISKKTPVFHLPIYSVKLNFENDKQVEFTCDQVDMMDLIFKLKALKNQWIKFGQAKI